MRRLNFAWIGIGVLALAAIVLVVRHSAGTVGNIANADFARLVSLVALLIVIGGSVLASRAFEAGSALRHASVWLGAALVLVTLYSYRQDFAAVGQRVYSELVPGTPIAATDAAGRTVVTLRRGDGGHFGARGTIDGASATFLVDTGASVLTLTPATAAAAGFDPAALRYTVPVQTANGIAFMAPVTINRLEIGPLSFHDLRAHVAPAGSLGTNLIGVNVLDRLDSYAVSGNEMVLTGRG